MNKVDYVIFQAATSIAKAMLFWKWFFFFFFKGSFKSRWTFLLTYVLQKSNLQKYAGKEIQLMVVVVVLVVYLLSHVQLFKC